MRHQKLVKGKSEISLDSDVEIGRCHRIGPHKKNRPRSGPTNYRCL